MLGRRTFLGATAALPLAACAGRPRLRIGYQNGLLLIAKARGDLDRVARVDWQFFTSGPPLLEAMSVGGIDIGGTGDTPPIVALSQGARVVLAAAQPVTGAAAAILVPRGSPLTSAGDMRGRRVARLRGSSAERFVRRALGAAGLSLADVEAINLAPDDAAAAFVAGSVDAWAVWAPWFAEAEAAGAHVLVPGRPLAASNSFIAASTRLAGEAPGALVAVLDVLRSTAAWAAAHRSELAAIISKAGNIAPAIAARVAGRQDVALEPLTEAVLASEQVLADELIEQKLIPARVDVGRLRWNGWRG